MIFEIAIRGLLLILIVLSPFVDEMFICNRKIQKC